MAKLKPIVLSKKTGLDGTTNIKIRLTHDHKCRDIATKYYIDPVYMGKDGRIKDTHPNHSKLNNALYRLLSDYNNILFDMDLENTDINSVVQKLSYSETGGASFTKYFKERIKKLRKEKRISYAVTYEATLTHLNNYTLKEDILFKEITVGFLQGFEKHLQGRKVNTIRIYLNNIRAVFNHAIDNGAIKPEMFPFRKFKVKQGKPEKRSLDVVVIKKLMIGPYMIAQQRSIDLFMLIFYLIGINIKDLLYLTPKDYRNGRITYKRFKTGGKFDILVVPQAKEIIEKYKGKKYLLNILDQDDSYGKYKNVIKETDKRLKFVAKYNGLDVPLSTYYARHSFATIARELGVSFDDIKMALGHDQKDTTSLYIDYNKLIARVDEAQIKVIDYLLK